MLLLFKWALNIEDPSVLNVSSLIFHALRHSSARNLNRTDMNEVMKKVFKTKKSASKGIYSMINIINLFDEKLLSAIVTEREAGIYKSADIDDKIRSVIVVFRKDLTAAIPYLTALSRRADVTNSSLWYIVNQTAISALKDAVKWVSYLSQNSFVEELNYQGSVPLDQWLVNSGIGFNEDQYKKDQERRKDRDLNNRINRQAVNSLQTITKSLSRKNPSNTKKGDKGSKRPNFKQALREVETILNTHTPNVTWDKESCVFYNHPDLTCKNGNSCHKNHTCPACNGAHPIYQCPGFGNVNGSSN